MIFAFLSSRVRTWLLLGVLVPLVGRVLQSVGVRVGDRSPRVGSALQSAGGLARDPRGRRGRR